MTRILFVCTGNTCRSPLAAAIARKILKELNRDDVEVESAGTDAWEGGPATDEALLVGMERGMDLSAHHSRNLSGEIVRGSTLILAMGPQHLVSARRLGGDDRSYLLAQYAQDAESERAITDPFGGDLDAYRATADDLETHVGLALSRFLSGPSSK